jgi:hypothetical protein
MIGAQAAKTAQAKSLTLVVFMEPGEDEWFKHTGSFRCQREPFADGMMEFSKKTKKLPYGVKFVSITVLREGEEICQSAASIYGDNSCGGSPIYAVLKITRKLLEKIEVVGDDDVRQTFTEIAKRWKSKAPYDSLLKRIDDLRTLTAEQKLRRLRKRTFNRGQHKYTEARLNRALMLLEVKSWGKCD